MVSSHSPVFLMHFHFIMRKDIDEDIFMNNIKIHSTSLRGVGTNFEKHKAGCFSRRRSSSIDNYYNVKFYIQGLLQLRLMLRKF